MKNNKIREMLNNGEATVGFRMWSTNPYFVESIGTTGNYDYIEFAGEYSPFSQNDLRVIAMAAELHNMSTMIKVDFQNRGYIAQKAIANGFQAILFSDCHTPEDVRESIKLVTPDTPMDKGSFGYPTNRFIGFQPSLPQMDHAKRSKDIVKAFMIEKNTAVETIEEICRIPGVDMIQFGGSDYSMSNGYNKSEKIEHVKEIERHVIKVALENGVEPRCEIRSLEPLQYYLDLGVRQFSFGDELIQLNNFWKGEGKEMKDIAKTLTRTK